MIKKSIVFAAFDEEYVATIEFKLAKPYRGTGKH